MDTGLLHGKVAVITGATRGIGLAIAEALLERGASVIAGGATAAHLGSARERLGKVSGHAARFEVVQADVRDPVAAEALISLAISTFGGLDILVNNAGVGGFSPVADMSLEQWRRIIDTNLSGVFHCCRAAIPHLRRRGGGWIINISSLAGKNAFAGGGAYCASKAGLNAFSESLMQEVRYDDIRVSYVMPGSVETDFTGPGPSSQGSWKLAAADVAQVVADLLQHPARSLPSRVEVRPSKPKK